MYTFISVYTLQTLEPQLDIEEVSIADLFIGLLKYLSVEMRKETDYVSILTVEKCSKNEKSWNTKRLAIEGETARLNVIFLVNI